MVHFVLHSKQIKILIKPEFGHLYLVTKEGGISGTEPLFENGICWPNSVLQRNVVEKKKIQLI